MSVGKTRSKTFFSYNSLKFESERLDTFVGWPVDWLPPEKLAADGFYYLRTKDHCACVFCLGIIGSWEPGDTPRGEHRRFFGHRCKFVQGEPVGNIPLCLGYIVSNMQPVETDPVDTISSSAQQVDEAGSIATGHGPLIFPRPKRRDYLTLESRIGSFAKWPERVVQRPVQLALAGFFACGLSDHVMCYYCGGGLRNWEVGDGPWVLHARWFPDCQYAVSSMYAESVSPAQPNPYQSVMRELAQAGRETASSGFYFKPLPDTLLRELLQLDTVRDAVSAGFDVDTVLTALQRKLRRTGIPFCSPDECTEAVCTVMEEEAKVLQQRQAHEQSSEKEDCLSWVLCFENFVLVSILLVMLFSFWPSTGHHYLSW